MTTAHTATPTVTASYLMGIAEGRQCLKKHGVANISIQNHIENLRSTLKGFAASSEVGQMLRGELDFWLNQESLAKAGAA